MYKSIADRLRANCVVSTNGCWLWSAYKMKNGYGMIRFTKGTKLAHRVAYETFKGPILTGMDVMHVCDTPACINPEHLTTGTRAENMADAKAKGRSAIGNKHGNSRLTEEQVVEIRRLNNKQREIADLYGISQSHVSEIKCAKRWAHIR